MHIVHLAHKMSRKFNIKILQNKNNPTVFFYSSFSILIVQREGQGRDEGHRRRSRRACLARKMHLISVAYFGESGSFVAGHAARRRVIAPPT